MAASAAGTADLLSRPKRGVCDDDRPGLERQGRRRRLRHAVRDREALPRRYAVQQAGGRTILEYWIPAEDLEEFNRHIVGLIEVVAEFR
ncbi:hypothetical protein [Lapillicoccus sp.]|uniref:hypothetical protein n=1 Tax=Lapillicoccus sp. TaxID=1909287 RepID=UPI002600620D|nr:hypothetical protein [Lapillicoccus sp.]